MSGGTGGARLAAGFDAVLPPGDLTVIANTGDDEEFWGLHVCPDIDAVVYRLAGVFDESVGYGRKDETFNTLEALARLGEETWFRLGDRDIAMHVLRAGMLARGLTLTEASLEIGRRFQLRSRVVPMSDDRMRTRVTTDRGTVSLQQYFVRDHLQPALRGIEFDGQDSARPSPAALEAMQRADLVVIGPSNPLISIDPILAVLGAHVVRDKTLAVTPIVGGRALKGPTVDMMRAMDLDPSPLEIARMYRDRCSRFVLDTVDAEFEPQIAALGYRVLVCDTVMSDGGVSLARTIVDWVTRPSSSPP